MAAVEAAAEPATVQPDLENGHGSENDSDEDEAAGAGGAGAGEKKKKKKKKPKKKKAGANGAAAPVSANGEHVKPAQKQTVPPSIPLGKIYTNGQYPVGEICEYKNE